MPNMYACGILFGKDGHQALQRLHSTQRCAGPARRPRFQSQGFSNTYNAIAGRVGQGQTVLGEVSRRWSAHMEFKPTKVGPLLPFLYKFTLKKKYRQGRKARCSTCRSWVALRAQVGLARGHTGTLREPL